MTPRYPIFIHWSDGEVAKISSEDEACLNLECFDSEDGRAWVNDATGHEVCLLIEFLDVKEFRYKTPGEQSLAEAQRSRDERVELTPLLVEVAKRMEDQGWGYTYDPQAQTTEVRPPLLKVLGQVRGWLPQASFDWDGIGENWASFMGADYGVYIRADAPLAITYGPADLLNDVIAKLEREGVIVVHTLDRIVPALAVDVAEAAKLLPGWDFERLANVDDFDPHAFSVEDLWFYTIT